MVDYLADAAALLKKTFGDAWIGFISILAIIIAIGLLVFGATAFLGLIKSGIGLLDYAVKTVGGWI